MADSQDPRLDALFARLAAAPDVRQAAVVEDAIWAVWLESGDAGVDAILRRGMRAMGAGDTGAAFAAFDEVVVRAPDFAEGWNKRATVRWLRRDLEGSVRDIERTLALEPRHFGALSGLALIREAQHRPFEALEALERVTALHPRLPGLEARVERLTRQLGEPI